MRNRGRIDKAPDVGDVRGPGQASCACASSRVPAGVTCRFEGSRARGRAQVRPVFVTPMNLFVTSAIESGTERSGSRRGGFRQSSSGPAKRTSAFRRGRSAERGWLRFDHPRSDRRPVCRRLRSSRRYDLGVLASECCSLAVRVAGPALDVACRPAHTSRCTVS